MKTNSGTVRGFANAPSACRGNKAAFLKTKANRAHRHRVKSDLKLSQDWDAWDDAPRTGGEMTTDWDIW